MYIYIKKHKWIKAQLEFLLPINKESIFHIRYNTIEMLNEWFCKIFDTYHNVYFKMRCHVPIDYKMDCM